MKLIKKLIKKIILKILNVNFYLKKRIEFYYFAIKYYNTNKKHGRFIFRFKDLYPCFNDNTLTTKFDRHYLYHTAWAAQKINEIKPQKHIDIASHLKFSTMVSAFVPVEFYDFRPAKVYLKNFLAGKADLLNLHFENSSIESLSCMHVVEHIGLGRYGDALDYEGDIKAIRELSRTIKQRGNLLFVVPIGNEPKIMYNAHRIYTRDMILDAFSELGFKCNEFRLIPEDSVDGALVLNPDDELLNKQEYACGCFWFIKE